MELLLIATLILCTYFIVRAIKGQNNKEDKVQPAKKEDGSQGKFSEQLSDLSDLYFAKHAIANNIAVDSDKSLDERIKFLYNEVINLEPDIIECEDIQELRDLLLEMNDKYTSLLKKNKSDHKKILELSEDWNDYLSALNSLKHARIQLVLDMTNETAEKYGEINAEPNKIKEEIEKKFASLL